MNAVFQAIVGLSRLETATVNTKKRPDEIISTHSQILPSP